MDGDPSVKAAVLNYEVPPGPQLPGDSLPPEADRCWL